MKRVTPFILIILMVTVLSCENTPKNNGKATVPIKEPAVKRTLAEISHKVNGNWEENKYIGGEWQNVSILKVPQEHTDHSEYIRYEGPGWESDKVGYRFYLDWRNAVDIFGKKTNDMVLQEVGLDGFSSYHEPADWEWTFCRSVVRWV